MVSYAKIKLMNQQNSRDFESLKIEIVEVDNFLFHKIKKNQKNLKRMKLICVNFNFCLNFNLNWID